jgi:hypothetical protein
VRVEVSLHQAVHPVFLLHRLTEMHAHGSTNLSGGLLEAFALALDERPQVGRRHVILMTDGVANVGETRRSALVDLARGVPLYIAEIVESLRGSGAVRRRPGTDSWYLASDELLDLSTAPLAVRLAERALSSLTPEMAAFARLCAVVGVELDAAEVGPANDPLHPMTVTLMRTPPGRRWSR